MTDPLNPDTDTVAPSDLVAELSPAQHQQRLDRLIEQAHRILDEAWEIHGTDRELAATCVLFSGGNDSTVLAHLMRERADYAVHCNTTIGVEATRQFVRDTCAAWELPLIEKLPPRSYRELVIERGFPGPGMHWKMFTRLKERSLEEVRRQLVTNGRRQRVIFVAGRRRAESARRAKVPLYERTHGNPSVVWASPLAMWTKIDMVAYRGRFPDVPFNPVTDHLGMSGECLCGSFAQDGELERIRLWYPDVAAEIDSLMREVEMAGHELPYCVWGHRQGAASKKVGALCTSCDFRQDEAS